MRVHLDLLADPWVICVMSRRALRSDQRYWATNITFPTDFRAKTLDQENEPQKPGSQELNPEVFQIAAMLDCAYQTSNKTKAKDLKRQKRGGNLKTSCYVSWGLASWSKRTSFPPVGEEAGGGVLNSQVSCLMCHVLMNVAVPK